MAGTELLKQHRRNAPRTERPRGRGAEQAGPHDRDLDPLHGRDDSRRPPAQPRPKPGLAGEMPEDQG